MNTLKVCVYAICKNEVQFVDEWVKSMSEADLIVVTDTGSTDGTVEKLRSHGVVVYQDIINPWRFDVARNVSLEHVPHDMDICLCTDLDELLNPGWRKLLETAWLNHMEVYPGNIKRLGKYLYNWSFKEDGTPDVHFLYSKVHDRYGFEWKCPIHEYVKYIGTDPLMNVHIDGMVLNHYPDKTKPRSSYYKLLQMAVEEEPNDSRVRYYLGREYIYLSMWEECIETLTYYLKMPTTTWNDERSAAMRLIAQAYGKLDNMKEAYEWYYKAIEEQPNMRDAYVELGEYSLNNKHWSIAYDAIKKALKIKDRSKTYINSGYAWDQTPYDICSVAAYYMGIYDEAYQLAIIAYELAPSIERLKKNVEICKYKLDKVDIIY